MSPHPKAAAIQLVHTRGENFAKSENWLRLYDCMDGHTRVFEPCSILCEEHGPLSADGEMRSELALIMYACAREIMWHDSYRFAPHMSLPREQDNVGIHVIIVILEASYRRARRDLFDGLNDSPVKFMFVT